MSLAFSSTIATHASDLEHALTQILDSSLHDATGVVLRARAQFWRELTSCSEPQNLFEQYAASLCDRAPNLDIFLLLDAHSAVESMGEGFRSIVPIWLIEGAHRALVLRPVTTDQMTNIRTAELSMLFEMGRARSVTCASTNHHFALPSGAHSSQFLRLSDAFTEISAVDRVAYWIALDVQAGIPAMQDGKPAALLVDHPSMLILAARVQRLVPTPLEIVAFPTYPSDVQSRRESFELMKQASSRTSAVFVVIGVASTGRLATLIQNWATGSASVGVKVIVLYSLQPLEHDPILCSLTLPEYKHFSSLAECALCAAHSHAVQVHSSSYLVGYAPSEPVALPPPFFNAQREFLERWGQHEGVLRVHYDDPNESSARHHAFYIDVGSLLNIADFSQLVVNHAMRFAPQPDAIAIPDHPTARRIGKLVSEATGKPLVILDNAMISKGQGEKHQELDKAKCVLVIDDIFITGGRLIGINRFAREHGRNFLSNVEHIHFWTLIATPASPTNYARVKRGLVGNHGWESSLSHIFYIPLPSWHEGSNCPWCQERNVLRGIAQSTGDYDGPIVDRLSVLESTVEGITDEPFFVSPSDFAIQNLGAQSVALGEGASPMQTLFSFASAIQQLRHAERNSLNADQFPAPAFLAERVFSTNYTERLIWNTMIRSLKSKELEPALKSYLEQCAVDNSDAQLDVIRGELAIAWLTGKLGSIPVSQQAKAFFEDIGIPWNALFAMALVDRDPDVTN